VTWIPRGECEIVAPVPGTVPQALADRSLDVSTPLFTYADDDDVAGKWDAGLLLVGCQDTLVLMRVNLSRPPTIQLVCEIDHLYTRAGLTTLLPLHRLSLVCRLPALSVIAVASQGSHGVIFLRHVASRGALEQPPPQEQQQEQQPPQEQQGQQPQDQARREDQRLRDQEWLRKHARWSHALAIELVYDLDDALITGLAVRETANAPPGVLSYDMFLTVHNTSSITMLRVTAPVALPSAVPGQWEPFSIER
jgi:hypothetical protein